LSDILSILHFAPQRGILNSDWISVEALFKKIITHGSGLGWLHHQCFSMITITETLSWVWI